MSKGFKMSKEDPKVKYKVVRPFVWGGTVLKPKDEITLSEKESISLVKRDLIQIPETKGK